ncbi:PIG-L family deacetylase [uncultured Eudoraea sp.]|uniref:PIG-L family deacetylase n=1 Tax=uncultured Eudoraea sp. TaxID=1035614 RepID=UPI002637536C|nr:PIG-L family deacetylase [uncultured Eudoraea sp.]
MRYYLVLFIGLFLGVQSVLAQVPKKSSSSDIFHSLQKLNFLGSALYIAAHPDDENTRLISYLSNEVKARTGYLSITRGDGGQNLIGSELRELLGVLRTEELLAAREVDGGEQFFTRANDFGYSKHPVETLKIWDKKAVLGDVVWVLRNFKPDVIVNRFDHRTPGSTHGHHTSSAMLSVEAFDLANDKNAYPEQLDKVSLWQPKRSFFNASWWFYGSPENFEKADKSKMVNLDVGVYYPMRGLSNNEIASIASSQHLSQGFGRLSVRGSQDEYIELLSGDMPNDTSNIFEGIDTSWSRIKGGEAIGKLLVSVEENFDFVNPSKHLPELLEAHKLLVSIEDDHWRHIKLKELQDIILTVCGLYLEASSAVSNAVPGSSVKINIEVLNRSNTDILFNSVTLASESYKQDKIPLANNQKKNLELDLKIPEDQPYTSPYWLAEKGSLGMYKVNDPQLIGSPETIRPFHASFELEFNGYSIKIEKPVIHRYSKPDKGELYEPFEIIPEATARFGDKVLIFADRTPRKIPVTITAHKNGLKGNVHLGHNKGWVVDKEFIEFEIANKDDEKTVVFTLTPPAKEDESLITPIIHIDGKKLDKELIEITYDHIPTQTVLIRSEAKVVRLNIKKVGEQIGYIMGAGDEVPESLEQIGYTVHLIDPTAIESGSLNKYDAVVTGIRAYNVIEALEFKQRFLLEYVEQGGNLIIQYNTAGRRDASFKDLAPYPLKISRDRITNEDSEVKIIASDHSVINFPNTITNLDFEGWVQERGLYFPDEWDPKFTPILQMNDKGESPTNGALLVAPYGKGNYIYTGISFFRELPAGVSGAYKLFANILSLGKEQIDNTTDIKGK